MSKDIHGPGITVTGGSTVGNINRTGPAGARTPTPPNPGAGGGGINVTGGSRTGHIAYGPGASAGGAPTTSAPTGRPTPGTRTSGNYRTWDDVPGASSSPGGDQGGTYGGGSGAEFGDLATVRRFAEQISALGEGSDFVQVIKACSALQDMVRDFGGDMNKSVSAFVDAATAVARSGQELMAQAVQVAGLASDMSGA